MTANTNFASVNSYISTLLNRSDSDSTERKYINKSEIEDDFEKIVDDYYNNSNEESIPSLSGLKYLPFSINGLGYIVLSAHVITVKRIYAGGFCDDVEIIDAGGILGRGGSGHEKYQYALFLKGQSDYVIAVDSVDALLELSDHELRLRKSLFVRPWLQGISTDHQHLLLDSYALGKTVCASPRTACGIKFAVI